MARAASEAWQSLLERPDDVPALQVYADALLDEGDARGELIALEVQLHALPAWDERRPAMEAQARALRRRWQRAWTSPVLEALQLQGAAWYGLSVQLELGVPATLSVDAKTLLREPEAVFRAAPLSQLKLYAVRAEDVRALSKVAGLRRIRALELHFGNSAQPSSADLDGFFAEAPLDALRSLAVDVTGLDTARALARAPALARLERLSLHRALHPLEVRATLIGNFVGAQGLEALFASPHLKALRWLRLSRQTVGVPGAALLAEAKGLEGLELIGCHLGARGAQLLAQAKSLPALQSLMLAADEPKAPGLEALAAARAPRLHTLSLARCGAAGVGEKGAALVGGATWASQLRRLDLAGCGLGSRGAWALASSPALAGLRALDVSDDALGDQGAAALASATHLVHLRELHLSSNGVGSRGVGALARSPVLAAVEVLALDHNPFEAAGGAALGESAHLGRLWMLVLSHNGLGRDGLRWLLSNQHLGALEEVVTGLNELEDDLLACLLRFPHLRLEVLRLSHAAPELVDALAEEPRAQALRALHLGVVEGLDDRLARKLASSPHLAELGELSLSAKDLGAAGKAALEKRFGPRLVRTG